MWPMPIVQNFVVTDGNRCIRDLRGAKFYVGNGH